MAGACKSRLEKRSPIAGSQIDTAQLDLDNTGALVATPGVRFELTYRHGNPPRQTAFRGIRSAMAF